ncbi:MAG TPA: hypothetical protein PLK31_06340 [Chloroflexota bacterium]|nr:hypothetical protein [Chloroflexota bacterium]
MTGTCCCPTEAGNAVCELPAHNFQRPPRVTNTCPTCGIKGKPVQGQTVKALLSVSLREVQDVEYLFCKTQTCPVVYFSPDSEQTFTVEHVRERVYQKEPDGDDVFVCYCFRHKGEDIRAASSETVTAIVDDINTGINAGQCACDLRNPQGSCCLGNVRALIKRISTATAVLESPR